jgi:NADH:ubiquinone oxidoreductase subunit F (NADH-binding)/NADH:ubiquinone oxidoreductase subunit E
MITQALHRIQEEHGYLPKEQLLLLAQQLRVPLYRLQEVASFFPHYHLHPPAKVEALVCHDMACSLRGAARLQSEVAGKFPQADQVDVKFVSCLGRCDRAPAACVNGHFVVEQSSEKLQRLIEGCLSGAEPKDDLEIVRARHAAKPWLIDPYEGEPTYAAVRQFVEQADPGRLTESLKTADLRGMGGAGVPAFQKWTDVRQAKGDQKYIICNGDESEPGTFKDRELLLRTPHLILEGVILAGLFTGATRGFIYIRHEYPEQIAAMEEAIRRAERMKICGRQVLNTGREFVVEVFVSPGGYICGEQSALVEAIEDHRAQPRNKPPQLETNGLYDKPTLVSNVETYAWAPAIALKGGEWYRDLGRNGCKGARFFSISGDINRPGAYEVPNGISLGELVMDLCGGMSGGQKLKAIALSGPSGGFLPAALPANTLSRTWKEKIPAATVAALQKNDPVLLDLLAVELDLQRCRDMGIMLGAGIVVYGDRADMVAEALNCVEFFRNESCGKCVPCRIGSQKIVEIATALHAHRISANDFAERASLVNELVRTMELTSICGLGMVAGKPLASLLQYFKHEVDRYLAPAPG